jgi:triphosphatase
MAAEPKETELKLSVPAGALATLKRHPAFGPVLRRPARSQRLHAIYYDTDGWDLRDHGVTLRVRRENGRFVQTIKSADAAAAGALERAEWEQAIVGRTPDLQAAANNGLPAVVAQQLRDRLQPVFETRIRRELYRLGDASHRVELAFDRGEIVAGARRLAVCELELELKGSDRAALFDLARAIADLIPAQLALRSKSERGYLLAQNRPGKAMFAEPADLAQGTTTGQAFQVVARGCLRHIIDNVPGMAERNPEALHQMRIGLRRLRTALSLFADVVRDDGLWRIKAELKWLSKELSPARDLDALLDEVMKPLRRQHPDHRGLASLHGSFSRQRLAEYKRAAETVQSPRFRRLLLDTYAWIETGEWTTRTDEAARLQRDRLVEDHAGEELKRRRKKISKRGRAIEALDPQRRHKLRIQVKKTRYATEFFAGVFREKKSAKRGAKLLSVLKRLQTSLGGLNDVATRRALCEEILARHGRRADGPAERERVFAAGLVAGEQEARANELLARAKKAHARMEHIKPFWK